MITLQRMRATRNASSALVCCTRDTYEHAKEAPDLRGCLGAALAQQGVQGKEIADYFVPLESSIKRHCGAFRLSSALAELRGFDVVKTSISDVAGLLLQLHHVSPWQARNAHFLLQSCKCNNFLRPGSLSTFVRWLCTLNDCAFFKL